jgi:hypothetical protein
LSIKTEVRLFLMFCVSLAFIYFLIIKIFNTQFFFLKRRVCGVRTAAVFHSQLPRKQVLNFRAVLVHAYKY